VKSILRENSSKVVWLFSLSYGKVHVNVYVVDDRRRWTTADDESSVSQHYWTTPYISRWFPDCF